MSSMILLFGMPRSGTTWIGKIFDSHPATLYRHEPDSWGLLNDMPMLPETLRAEEYRPLLESFVRQLPAMRQTKVSASLPIFPKQYYSPLAFQLRRMSVLGAKLASRVLGEFSSPDFIHKKQFPNISIVWKSIESAGRLGVAARVLADSKGFLLMRHPCGYAASVLRGESERRFTGATPSSDDYDIFSMLLETPQAKRHELTLEKLQLMTPVERLAWRWALYNEKALDDIEGLSNCMAVKYEDVCEKPLEMAQTMFAFAGIPWNPQSELFVRASTSQDKSAYYSVFKDPRKSASKWREFLSSEDISRVMRIVEQTRSGQFYLA